MHKRVVIIGSGFAGLSAAASLAKKGYSVDVLEQHAIPGGRARYFDAEGFRFDMGPSWYWMPDVFERFFNHFGKTTADYYDLVRLDPSYRVYFGQGEHWDIPADMAGIRALFERVEPGAGRQLEKFMAEAACKYEVGMRDLVYRPGRSWLEYADRRVLRGIFRLHMFRSFSGHVRKFFRDPRLISLMEFPVLFLGAKPARTPALYSLMNYADMQLGTWYPLGGMHRVAAGMTSLARESGVRFHFGEEVREIRLHAGRAREVVTASRTFPADIVVGGADYHHVEQDLLPAAARSYSAKYWQTRVMAPSSLIFYLGIGKRLENLLHHNLFFDEAFAAHAAEIYDAPRWPSKPLFYVCAPSRTDPTVAPDGMENLFILVPVAPGLEDDEARRAHYYDLVMDRLERLTGQAVRPHVVYRRSYAHSDFIADYHAFRGNAYGLANTLRQTAVLKPRIKSRKVPNLYFTGQLTVPGPGVPPSLISGRVVAEEIGREFKLTKA